MRRPFLQVCLVVAIGCGGSSDHSRRTVFDPNGGASSVVVNNAEVPYPPLDLNETPGGLRWIGVSILGGRVHLSRPVHWRVRDASDDPGRSYVRYVSPRAYTFAVYERKDESHTSWSDIMQHYEADVAASGAKVVGQHIPIAVGLNQGRAYTLERKVDAGGAPVLSRSREILVRNEHLVLVVQIVGQDDRLAQLTAEALEILRHIEVP